MFLGMLPEKSIGVRLTDLLLIKLKHEHQRLDDTRHLNRVECFDFGETSFPMSLLLQLLCLFL